jgi:hypothetical protein
VPPPFGPARNGAIVASHDGDIYAVEPGDEGRDVAHRWRSAGLSRLASRATA